MDKPKINELFNAFQKFALETAKAGYNEEGWKRARQNLYNDLEVLGIANVFDWEGPKMIAAAKDWAEEGKRKYGSGAIAWLERWKNNCTNDPENFSELNKAIQILKKEMDESQQLTKIKESLQQYEDGAITFIELVFYVGSLATQKDIEEYNHFQPLEGKIKIWMWELK